jgi:hypothetical protein
LRRCALIGYVGCRDYANYNLCYRHEDIMAFYAAIADRAAVLQEPDIVEAARACEACMADVGIEHEGVFYPWTYGLCTGWRHTMLLHCVSNPALGKLVSDIIADLVPGSKVLLRAHQGDDSVEIGGRSWIGPALQAFCDSAGKRGQPGKQLFADRPGRPYEFLRELHGTISPKVKHVKSGSWLRRCASGYTGDAQQPVSKGGLDTAVARLDVLNSCHRALAGQMKLRWEDVFCLLDYWSSSSLAHSRGVPLGNSEAVFAPKAKGGLGMRWAGDPGRYYDGHVTIETVQTDEPVCEVMKAIATWKLAHLSPVDLRPWTDEYFADASACRQRKERTGRKVPGSSGGWVNVPASRREKLVADWVVREHHKGTASTLPADEMAKEAAVAGVFGGSERTAHAAMRDCPGRIKHTCRNMSALVRRGLDVIRARRAEPVIEGAESWTGVSAGVSLLHNAHKLFSPTEKLNWNSVAASAALSCRRAGIWS